MFTSLVGDMASCVAPVADGVVLANILILVHPDIASVKYHALKSYDVPPVKLRGAEYMVLTVTGVHLMFKYWVPVRGAAPVVVVDRVTVPAPSPAGFVTQAGILGTTALSNPSL